MTDDSPGARTARRRKLIQELFASEARYATALRLGVRVAEQCRGWAPPLAPAAALRPPACAEVWCLRASLEQLAALSEATVVCLSKAMRETGGDRVAKVLLRLAGMLPLYEQYAGAFAFAGEALREAYADPDLRAEWRTLVLATRTGQATFFRRGDWALPVSGAAVAEAAQAQLPTTLDGLLIMPIQRLPRLELLLDQIAAESAHLCAAQGDDGWLGEERRQLSRVLGRVRATTEKMEAAVKGALKRPFAVRPPSSAAREERVPTDGSDTMALLLSRERDYLARISFVEKHVALPLLAVAYDDLQVNAVAWPQRPATWDGSRRPGARHESIGAWLQGLPDVARRQLADALRSSGLVVWCQSVVQQRQLSEHLVERGLLDATVEDACDLLLWWSCLGLAQGVHSCVVLSCLDALLLHHDRPVPGLGEADRLQYAVPAWMAPHARLVRKCFATPRDSLLLVHELLDRCDRACFEGQCLADAVRLPLDHAAGLGAALGRVVMRPGAALRPLRSNLVAALRTTALVRAHVQHCLDARALGLGLGLALEAANEDGVGVDGAALIRFGALYVRKKAHLAWLYTDALVLGAVRSASLAPSKTGRRKRLRVSGLVRYSLDAAGSIVSESASATIALSADLTLTVPPEGDALAWAAPKPSSDGLFAAWARDIAAARAVRPSRFE